MRKALFLIITTLAVALQALAQPTPSPAPRATYTNPVIAGDFADPSLIRIGETYFAVGTSSEWGPAYPIYSSKDLVNWSYVGPGFNELPAWTMGSYWAPELFYRNDTYYLYYTARRKSDQRSFIGVATTRDLTKGFTDHGLLLEWTTEAIDPFIIEEGGKWFITWKAYGLDKGRSIEILGAELSADGRKVTGQAFTLIKAEPANWEKGGVEGQAIFKRGRYYYMLYSGNACCGAQCDYQVGLARAEKLQGPWEKYINNPLLVSNKDWKCPGHGTVVVTPDERYFYLHHAYDGTDFTSTGRQGVLSELIWPDKSQWPTFRYGHATPTQAESPLQTTQRRQSNLTVNFSQARNSVPWVWDVSLPKPVYQVNQGQLQLVNASSSQAGTFLGLVVKKGTYTMSADIVPQADLLQSLCVYGDAQNQLGIGIRQGSLELWQIKAGTRRVLKTQPVPDDTPSITLQIRSQRGQYYEFGWRTKEGKYSQITDAPLDGSFLPRWDRAPRSGIGLSGKDQASSLIRTMTIHYDES
ncbi:glycoside hydrolase family 43 protein [Spirosoma utsteinense]|uniref:Beta-xylosidase n=1 Tax=Spirosoma utsteinense TaxID=2585773 RepID=A0ABR6WBE5_9BACT|nr:glycoside hydrolase family 43 protein [Spirosoma utsteinense]MBC3785301.1 beta-xylosidase [Spirosoma utsteinense]MBC3793895.1 beta-xylosidase [Spirosoma utsteinense]